MMLNHLVLGQALVGNAPRGWGDATRAPRLSLIARVVSATRRGLRN